MPNERFRADPALAPLKGFQRRTVDYVFDRLYGQEDPVRQFLVADEVGLGKTMVARGVIARMIEHLWDTTKRIDIVYICSNQAIAAQNLNRLNVLGRRELALPTRMTLVPLQLRGQMGLDANKVNFISLTPGTTFDLRSSTGVTQERALLCHLLRDLVTRPRGLHNLLQVTAGKVGWNRAVNNLTLEGIDKRIIKRFRCDVKKDRDLFGELERVCELFPYRQKTYPPEKTQPRNSVVARLRAKLSYACVEALQPDLIIMDEFQRFRDLLHGDSDAAILARELFDYSGGDGHAARTLLLSATPYRMLTLAGDEPDEGDHYQDFLETLSFLYGQEKGPEVTATLAREMRTFRSQLHALPLSHTSAVAVRQSVERCLRRVIARTERVSSTVDRDSMMKEFVITASVSPTDLLQAAAAFKIARMLAAPEIIEYWKSAPYLLNFMRDDRYRFKRLLENQIDKPSTEFCNAMRVARSTMLNRNIIEAYKPVDPANGRMRVLMDDLFSQHLEQHLWIPASMPYYGDPRSLAPLTKALIFSSWSMVPDAIAALLSYEAERRMGVGESGQRYFEQHRLRPLQFRQDHGRLAGLRAMLLIYPSPVLAELADPLAVFSANETVLSLEDMRAAIGDSLKPALSALQEETVSRQDANSAEWAAPAVIDDLLGARSRTWLETPNGMRALASEDAFQDHVAELAAAVKSHNIGAPTPDLLNLLVDVALGSPAICALRALKRIAPELAWDTPCLLSAAAEISWSFRTLFNQRDAVALLRRDTDDHYWRRVLVYCAQHNLQAVLDEYAHYLVDAEGLGARSAEERAIGVARAMAEALAIRPSQIDVDDVQVAGKSLVISKFQMRGRFAMRLADYKDEDGTVARLGGVRDAFNSPFRPFVLATTSIGQEGLDFHPYCYRVYHWNLPGNPVDLEQREGRIHRFKSHAVRLNLADRQAVVIRGCGRAPGDPWKQMFAHAQSETEDDTDLIPYWIYEGQVKIERRVPVLPFSREITRLAWLKRSLAVYRLAFGQPRQDELLDYLNTLTTDSMDIATLEELQIRLEPPTMVRCAHRDRPDINAGYSDALPSE